jgi:hypothetical protein
MTTNDHLNAFSTITSLDPIKEVVTVNRSSTPNAVIGYTYTIEFAEGVDCRTLLMIQLI